MRSRRDPSASSPPDDRRPPECTGRLDGTTPPATTPARARRGPSDRARGVRGERDRPAAALAAVQAAAVAAARASSPARPPSRWSAATPPARRACASAAAAGPTSPRRGPPLVPGRRPRPPGDRAPAHGASRSAPRAASRCRLLGDLPPCSSPADEPALDAAVASVAPPGAELGVGPGHAPRSGPHGRRLPGAARTAWCAARRRARAPAARRRRARGRACARPAAIGCVLVGARAVPRGAPSTGSRGCASPSASTTTCARSTTRFRGDPLIGPRRAPRPAAARLRRPDPFEALAGAICEQLIEFERAAAIERGSWRGSAAAARETGLRDVPDGAARSPGAAPALLAVVRPGGGPRDRPACAPRARWRAGPRRPRRPRPRARAGPACARSRGSGPGPSRCSR